MRDFLIAIGRFRMLIPTLLAGLFCYLLWIIGTSGE